MKVVDSVTTPGGLRANEDRVGHAGNLAWVIDGATNLYDGAAMPAGSDVQWLVNLVGQELTLAGQSGYRGSGADLLESVANEVYRRQVEHGFPADRVPPACSVAVCVDQGAGYDITRIGDATAAVVSGDACTVLSTDYFDGREAAAVRAAEPDPRQVVAAMHRRRLHTMTSGDAESVFSGHPDRLLRPHTVEGVWRDTELILLCTDGFARLITDYGKYDQWADLVADARERGLAYLEKLIRDVESDPPDGGTRFKWADDVAAVLLTCDPG